VTDFTAGILVDSRVLALALWAGGIVLIGLAVWRGRAPYARMKQLDQLAENARRYESWRGGRKTSAAGERESGADVMRALLRREVNLWLAVGVAGVVLLVAGFFVG
jgi:hypothetical protein